MIRILEIGMTKNIGGIQTFLLNFNRSINPEEVKIDYVCIYKDQNVLYFKKELDELGGEIINIPDYHKNLIASYRAIKKLVHEGKYDVVHYNMNSAAYIIPLMAAKAGGAPIVIAHAHNSSSDKGFLKSIIHWFNKHFISLYTNLFFACSDKAGKWFFSKKIRESAYYHFIPNAIDIKKYEFNLGTRKRIRKELGYNDEHLVIGLVGRFAKQKNHKYLISIFHRILQKKDTARLLLIGHGPLKEKVEAQIQALGIQDKVTVLSFRKDVPDLLQAMDCFIMPSIYEGLPVVGVEAQASGLPCFFSDNITRELNISDKAHYFKLKETEILIAEIEKLKSDQDRTVSFYDKFNIFDNKNLGAYIVNIILESMYANNGK
jgi:glycosyltransferase involved in cell wall biosynthesis